MNEPTQPVTIAFRIPGQWAHPGELIERLPVDHDLSEQGLTLPDGTLVAFGTAAADDQFAQIFRTSCREPATDDELETVDAYTVNVFLKGPGGSMDAARTMMQAAAAVVRAGGAGVFIDNSTLAHGGLNWIAMTDDGSADAVSFAFVGIIRGRVDVWTMGMHVLGLPDVIMKRTDADSFDIVEVIRYMSLGEKPMGHGHVLADLDGPRFQAFLQDGDAKLAGSPMHNPFGRLRMVSMRDIAEAN